MLNFFNYTLKDLQTLLLENGFKKFNAQQVFDWVYKKYQTDFSQMTNLSKTLVAWLQEHMYFSGLSEQVKQVSKDGTTKFLFKLEDGNQIETVLMHFDYGNSICVTTQVGCNMGCKFCASGQLKKVRNLEACEIVMQVYYLNKYLYTNDQPLIRNIVVMGIGEPLDNYENLSRFLNIVRDDHGIGIGSRKITVSTCGLVPRFDDWIRDFPQVGLAISLHAPNDTIRSQIMPINQAYNISQLMQAVKKYINATNRRITFEYILIDGINDSTACAQELAALVKDILCYINLIPWNPVNNTTFKRSQNVRGFYETLRKCGITATVRQEKGSDIDSSCGQLRAKHEA